MPAAPTLTPCAVCGRRNPPDAPACELCGGLLRGAAGPGAGPRSAPTTPAPRRAAAPGAAAGPSAEAHAQATARILGLPEPLWFLVLGAVLAPVFGLTPILRYMGWFLTSLVHEMGHCAVGLVVGLPAYPAIRLDGHAVAVHQGPTLVLPALWVSVLAGLAWWQRRHPWRAGSLAAAAVALLLLLATGGRELAFLLGGHLGELAFATLAFHRCLHGGFTESRAERAAYGAVGWYLMGSSVALCLGLVRSAAARAAYGENGSLGLTNDLIRVAEDVLGWPLRGVALLVLAASFLPLPLGAAWAWCSRDQSTTST